MKLSAPGIEPATRCSQDLYTTDGVTGVRSNLLSARQFSKKSFINAYYCGMGWGPKRSPFPNDKLNAAKLKEFPDDNSKFDENGRTVFK